jgi:hypothetical protein
LGIPDPFEAPVTPPQLTVAALRELLAAHGASPEVLEFLFLRAVGGIHDEGHNQDDIEENAESHDEH